MNYKKEIIMASQNSAVSVPIPERPIGNSSDAINSDHSLPVKILQLSEKEQKSMNPSKSLDIFMPQSNLIRERVNLHNAEKVQVYNVVPSDSKRKSSASNASASPTSSSKELHKHQKHKKDYDSSSGSPGSESSNSNTDDSSDIGQ